VIIPFLFDELLVYLGKSMEEKLLNRITINTEICQGKPSIRNTRYTIDLILDLMASGMSETEIIEDYPALETEDIKA